MLVGIVTFIVFQQQWHCFIIYLLWHQSSEQHLFDVNSVAGTAGEAQSCVSLHTSVVYIGTFDTYVHRPCKTLIKGHQCDRLVRIRFL